MNRHIANFRIRVISGLTSADVNAQALAFGLVGIFALFTKWIVLSETLEFLVVSRALGLSSVNDLSIFQRLTYWRQDFLVNFVLIAGLLPIALHLLWPRGARYIGALLAMTMVLVVYAAKVSVGNVGTYLSLDMLVDAVRWAWNYPSSIGDYVGVKGFVSICILSLGLLLLCIRPNAAIHLPVGAPLASRFVSRGILGIVLLGVVGLVVSSLGNVPGGVRQQQQALIVSAVAALAKRDDGASVFSSMPEAEVQARFRAATDTPEWTESEHFGKEFGSDVLIFVFETGPLRSMSRSGGLESMPTLARLAERSFIATRHHSTYPYTSDAVFSILTGLYPVRVRDKVSNSKASLSQALPSQLTRIGYATARYAYTDSFEADSATFRNMGVRILYEGDRPPAGTVGVHPESIETIFQKFGRVSDAERPLTEHKLNTDLTSLNKLKDDIATYNKRDARYLAIYFPLIGHAPWADFGGQKDTVLKGRRILEIQDAWLGEIVEQLENSGRLEHTVIVVTADHGIRTVTEDPTFAAGTIDSYSFEVPLLIFAPNALHERISIAEPTSHVDITPTVLDLLGIRPNDRGRYQGVPIYSHELGERRLLFFAGGYLGADGYLTNDTYKMRSTVTGQTFSNSEMTFPVDTVVSEPDVGTQIDYMYSLQTRWATIVTEAPTKRR
jgi:hypothetical protein